MGTTAAKASARPESGHDDAERAKAPVSEAPQQQPLWAEAHSPLPAPVVQFALKVAPPGDEYEQEAVRIAEQVTRTPDPAAAKHGGSGRCACGRPVAAGGMCDACRKRLLKQESAPTGASAGQPRLQRALKPGASGPDPVPEAEKDGEKPAARIRKGPPPSEGVAAPSLVRQIQETTGSGKALDEPTRTIVEAGLGADFGDVQVHADGRAAQMNEKLEARAFTIGNHIFFNQGQYRPDSREGRKLLVHELVHTLQQSLGPAHSPLIQRQSKEGTAAIKTVDNLLETGFFEFDWAVTDKEANRVLAILESLPPVSLLETVRHMRHAGNWKKFRENLPKANHQRLYRIDFNINPRVGYILPGDVVELKIYSEQNFRVERLAVHNAGISIAKPTLSFIISGLLPQQAANRINQTLIASGAFIEPSVKLALVSRGNYYWGAPQGPFSDLYYFSSTETVTAAALKQRQDLKRAEFLDFVQIIQLLTVPADAVTYYNEWVANNYDTPRFLLVTPSQLWQEALASAYKPVAPEGLDGAQQLPESMFAAAREEIIFHRAPQDDRALPDLKVAKGDPVELTWKVGEWYYAFSAGGPKGYLKAKQLHLPPSPPKRPPTEEFVSLIGDILFIQAPDMHRAFVLAKKAGLTPNVGMIFWYGNGRSKPYPVKYEITIREPNEAELEKWRKLGGFTAGPATGTTTSPALAKSTPTKTLSAAEKRWQEAAKELQPYVDKFLTRPSERVPGKLASTIPAEWIRAMNFTFEEFRVAKGFPFSREPDSDFQYYYTVFQLAAKARIKEGLMLVVHQPGTPSEDTGSMEWWVAAKEMLLKENEAQLEATLNTIVKEEQDKRKKEIEAFFQPYKDQLASEQDAFIKKAKKEIDTIENWYAREVARKAADKVLEERQAAIVKVAQADFEKSPLAAEIRQTAEKRYAAEVEKIIKPDPYSHPVIKADATLVGKLREYDRQLAAARDYKARSTVFKAVESDVGQYLRNSYPRTYASLLRIILVYFSDKLLVDDEGKITVYAIKKWAERNYQEMVLALQEFAPRFHLQMTADSPYVRLTTPGGYSFYTQAYVDMAYELIYARDFFKEVVEHPENDEGFWDGFTSKSTAELIPFIHTILSLSKIYEQMRVANKKLMGGPLTESEELLLQSVAALQQINQMKKKPFWYRVGEGVAEAIPFIGEFIITAPIGLAGARVGMKAAESAIRKVAIHQLESRLAKFVIKGVGLLAGSLAQTLANPLELQKNILAAGLHIVRLTQNEDGSFTVEVEASDESRASAIWKGFVTSYVNVFTERLGGKVLPFAASKVAGAFSRFLPMAARSSVVAAHLKSAAQALKKYAGFHGILGEYEEEVYGQIMEALLKGEMPKWDWEDQLQTFTVVAIVSSSMRGVQTMVAAYDAVRTFRHKGRVITLPTDVYTRLLHLTNPADLARFKEDLAGMKISESQRDLALQLADRVLAIEKEAAASGEQAAAQIPAALSQQTTAGLSELAGDLYEARKRFLTGGAAQPSGQPAQQLGTGQVESVLLKGDNGVTIPLLLYNLEHVDQWITETEQAVANLEGISVAELKRAAGVGNGIEENVQFWDRWREGWRPYLAAAQEMSPLSKMVRTQEGKVNVNGNLIISPRMLNRLLLMDQANLQRLLDASLLAQKAGDRARTTISEQEMSRLRATHEASEVREGEGGLVTFNNELSLSRAVLAFLLPTGKTADPAANKFLLEQSFKLDEGFKTLDPFKVNSALLARVEPRLAQAIQKGALPYSLLRALQVMLHHDIVGQTGNAVVAEQLLLRQLETVAATIEFESDYASLSSLLDHKLAEKVVWEGATELSGREKYIKLLQQIGKTTPISPAVMADLIQIGPVADEGTIRRLIQDTEFREALVNNPNAILILKKCKSPCFPPQITPAQIARLEKVMQGKSGADVTRLNEFIYQNRASQATLEAAIVQLETDFAGTVSAVEVPALVLPEALKKISGIETSLNSIIALGMPVAQLNNVLARADRLGRRGLEGLVYSLNSALQLANKADVKNFSKILAALESADRLEFVTAEHLIDEIDSYKKRAKEDVGVFAYPGLGKADALLDKFTIAQLGTLMTQTIWTDGFLKTLYAITNKAPSLTPDQISELVKQAGGAGKGNLDRLQQIATFLKGTTVSFGQIQAAIARADALAAQVEQALADPDQGINAIARIVWGNRVRVTGKGDELSINVPAQFRPGRTGSGEAAYEQAIRTPGTVDALVAAVVADGAIIPARWSVVSKTIVNSNIAHGMKSNILHELWGQANIEALRQQGFDPIIREVKITDGENTAVADAVAIRGNEFVVVEFKTMDATLHDAQKIIYPVLETGKVAGLRIVGKTALDLLFRDKSSKISFRLLEEKALGLDL